MLGFTPGGGFVNDTLDVDDKDDIDEEDDCCCCGTGDAVGFASIDNK